MAKSHAKKTHHPAKKTSSAAKAKKHSHDEEPNLTLDTNPSQAPKDEAGTVLPRPSFRVEEVADDDPKEEPKLDPNAFPPTHGLEDTETKEADSPNPGIHPDEPTAMSEHHSDTFRPRQDFKPSPDSPQPEFRSSRQPKRKFPLWIFIILLAVLIGIAVWSFTSSRSSEEEPSVTDILIETSTTDTNVEEAEPEEELDRADYQLQVLNGSGVKGAAGKMTGVLEAAGFEDVDTDNASDYDSTGVTIQVKDGEDQLGDLIEQDLEDDYEKIKVRDSLDDDSEFDAVITLGSQSGDEEEEEEVLGASDEVSQSTDKSSDTATDSATSP